MWAVNIYAVQWHLSAAARFLKTVVFGTDVHEVLWPLICGFNTCKLKVIFFSIMLYCDKNWHIMLCCCCVTNFAQTHCSCYVQCWISCIARLHVSAPCCQEVTSFCHAFINNNSSLWEHVMACWWHWWQWPNTYPVISISLLFGLIRVVEVVTTFLFRATSSGLTKQGGCGPIYGSHIDRKV